MYSKIPSAQIGRFMWATGGPPGSCRPQVGPTLAPWTLLSGFPYTNSCILSSLLDNILVICEKKPWNAGFWATLYSITKASTQWPATNLTTTQFPHNAQNIKKCPDENKHCIPTDKQHGLQSSAPELPEWWRDWILHHNNVCTHTPYTKPSAYLASAYEVYLVTLRPQALWGPVSSSRGL